MTAPLKETMEERFDETIVPRIIRFGQNTHTRHTTLSNEVKSFINSEISLALQNKVETVREEINACHLHTNNEAHLYGAKKMREIVLSLPSLKE